nr:YjbF family lipoprotein [Roseomonas rosulenta]
MIWPIPLPESLFEASTAVPEADWDRPGEAVQAEAALALTLGSRRGIATLVQEEGERRMWRTAGGVVLATDGPRIVATAGLRQVVAATRFDGIDPLTRIGELSDTPVSGARVVDVMRSETDPSRMRFGLRLDCRVSAGPAEVEDTLLVRETCRGAASFTNRFWADARSFAVFRSEQWVGEGLPPLVVEVLGPPVTPPEIIPLPR